MENGEMQKEPRGHFNSGFHRLFAVTSVGWIVTVLVAVTTREWRPEKLFNGGWETIGLSPMQELRMNWLSIAAVCIVPLLLGYVIVFLVIPWVYRGFRSAKQI